MKKIVQKLLIFLSILGLCISCLIFMLKSNRKLGHFYQKKMRQIPIISKTVKKNLAPREHNHKLDKHSNVIPRHIHQYWNGKSPPLFLMQQCRDLHPGWNYTLWTADSVKKLPVFHNRAIFDRYETQQVNGQSDIVRYSILREFGGVYLDADTVCLRPLDNLLRYGFFAGYHSKDNTGTQENNIGHPNRHLIASAVLGSVAQHPLIIRLTDDLKNKYQDGGAWFTVGPGHLTRTLKNCAMCNVSGDIKILPFHAFVPYHHEENHIIKSNIHNLWKLPKINKFKSYAMNLWGTTFNQWDKLALAKLPSRNTELTPKHNTVMSNLPAAQLATSSLNLSIIVPATFVDIEINLPALVASISKQNILNREIIIVLTGTLEEKCTDFKTQIVSPIPCHIFCFTTLRHEAWARNFGIRQASSEWVAFFDADDLLFPHHNSILWHWITCNPLLRLILHGYTSANHVDHKEFEVISGARLWKAAQKMQHQKSANPIFTSIMHSQPISRRSDALNILFKEIPGEDSMWCRDMVLMIGNHTAEMIADTTPLSWYIPRAGHKKKGFQRPTTLSSNFDIQTHCLHSQAKSTEINGKYLIFSTCFGSACQKYQNNFNTMQCYAMQHKDYDFIVQDLNKIANPALKQDCSKTDPMFLRHCVFANYLAIHKHYVAAFFIEADCAIFNYQIRFEDFLHKQKQISFDIRFHNGEITAGIYVVRNSAFALDFLKKWGNSKSRHNADNGALHRHILDTIGHNISCQSLKFYDEFMRCFSQTIQTMDCNHTLFSNIAFRHPMDAIQYDGWLLQYRYSNKTFVQHAMKNPPITIKGNNGYVINNRLMHNCAIEKLETHYITADAERELLEQKNAAKMDYRKKVMGFLENSCLARRLVK